MHEREGSPEAMHYYRVNCTHEVGWLCLQADLHDISPGQVIHNTGIRIQRPSLFCYAKFDSRIEYFLWIHVQGDLQCKSSSLLATELITNPLLPSLFDFNDGT